MLVLLWLVPTRAMAQDTISVSSSPEADSTLITPAMVAAGRKIFHGKGGCYACHGDKLQGGPVAPPLTGPTWRHISGSLSSILNRIDEGLPGTLMVSHPNGISETEVFMVASYVFSVSRKKVKP